MWGELNIVVDTVKTEFAWPHLIGSTRSVDRSSVCESSVIAVSADVCRTGIMTLRRELTSTGR